MKVAWRFRPAAGALVLAAGMLAAGPAWAQSGGPDNFSKLDDAVKEAFRSGASARVIMRYATIEARDRAFQDLLDLGAAVRVLDGDDPALNVLATTGALSAGLAAADRVSIDAEVSVSATDRRDFQRRASGFRQARTPYQRRTSDVRVAIIDSGVRPQADLPASRIVKWRDFVGGSSVPVDGCGHGTHVAGIIGGNGGLSGGDYAGVAPGADIVALRVLGDDCSGKTSDVIDALEWVRRNHRAYNIKVVNLSLGHPVFERSATDPLVHAVERLSARGVVVVTAAGNMGINPRTGLPGYGGVGVPCNAPRAICVGAGNDQHTDAFDDDTVTDYSSRGPTRFDLLAKPDLVATGHQVVSISAPGSALFEGYPSLHVFGGGEAAGAPAAYMTLSGTSMAAPMVAGAATLMLDANGALSANTVKMILQYTARVLPDVDVLTQGAGYLNVPGAVTLAKAVAPDTRFGRPWLREGYTLGQNPDVGGQTVTWGGRIIYGDRYIKGNAAYVHLARWDDNIVWGMDALLDNIVWGNCWDGCDNIVWGNYWDELDNIVWGMFGDDDNIVWGMDDDNIVWGNNIVWGFDNIVWGFWADNIVWGFWDDNIVWGNVHKYDQDNIVWGNDWLDNIVWGNCTDALNDDDNIVWGNCDDNIVWGNNIVWGFGNLAVLTGGVQ